MHFRAALSSFCLALSLSACGGTLHEPPVAQPYPLTGCSALAEEACNAAPGCVAIYGEEDAPQPVPRVATVSGCMPFQPVPFHHCEAAPTDGCGGLDEATCNASPGCAVVEAVTAARSGAGDDAVAGPPSYGGCVPVPADPCAGLDEVACLATPGCGMAAVAYGVPAGVVEAPLPFACVQVPGAPGPSPLPVDPPAEGEVCPALACLLYCEGGYAVDAAGCPTCACLP